MKKQTVKRIQRLFRLIALLGWLMFMVSCLAFMADGIQRTGAALMSAGGIGAIFLGVLFGGLYR